MTTVTMQVELDSEWVDCILITAFDGHCGSCWYWVGEEDDITAVKVLTDDQWFGIEFTFEDGSQKNIFKTHLSEAATTVLQRYAHTEAARQLREALATPDDLPDLDAEAADVLVQVALFGEIVFG